MTKTGSRAAVDNTVLAAKNIIDVFDELVQIVKNSKELEQKIRHLEQVNEKLSSTISSQKQEITKLKKEKQVLEIEKNQLSQLDYPTMKELEQARQEIARLKKQLDTKTTELKSADSIDGNGSFSSDTNHQG
jgi:DNA repair exonuclease SbcCD ATPase subunit